MTRAIKFYQMTRLPKGNAMKLMMARHRRAYKSKSPVLDGLIKFDHAILFTMEEMASPDNWKFLTNKGWRDFQRDAKRVR